MFETILIANRGEIACRVIRSARRLGVRTVAVYSEADVGALHVREADMAIPIGPAPAAESYLCGDRVLEAAKRSGATAIHPGYGFLSENADFAEACEAAGVTFIGPPSEAIRAMGLKDAAKVRMEAAGVPVVPGYHGEDQDPEALRAAAESIGFPVLIKAVAGGGGKGMRLVESGDEFDAALQGAMREGEAAFGDARVLVEKYLTKPRHIEIQVFSDGHGNTVHLFERDCSLQRRHQKVVEEAPGPGVAPALREAMGEAAVRAARAIDYRGAGTIEFIVDVSEGIENAPFYFMEMNTRLQVEHPVTEAITGVDLVEWQLRVAAGEPLPLTQDDLEPRGHAFEVRVYAEDPARRFLPQTGRLVHLRTPEESDRVRIDTGVVEGDEVSVHYDPMIAKLIVHDESREAALRGVRRALERFEIGGLRTNLPLLLGVAASPHFEAAEIDTGFLPRHLDELLAPLDAPAPELVALACAGWLARRANAAAPAPGDDPWSPWSRTDAFRLNETGVDVLHWIVGGKRGEPLEVTARFEQSGLALEWPGNRCEVRDVSLEDRVLRATVEGQRLTAHFVEQPGRAQVFHRGQTLELGLREESTAHDDESAGGDAVLAPMPGTIIEILVAEGDRVTRGQAVLRLEAMKMEHTLRAPARGKVKGLSAQAGDRVDEGVVLFSVETS
jgi:3-methylcrotonyl-CoA carboxylase alpha subunit